MEETLLDEKPHNMNDDEILDIIESDIQTVS